MTEILLVEDDPILGKSLCLNLELENYKVTWTRDVKSTLEEQSKNKFSLIILDLGLPDGSGLTFCNEIRKAGSRTPVIMLTAQTDEDSVVKGLSAGANDYVRKPFGNRELLARIKKVLHEPVSSVSELRIGDLTISLEDRRVRCGDQDIDFNRREFDIFSVFMQNAGTVITRDTLLEALDKNGEIYDRTIDSHLSHIRAKLRAHSVTSPQIVSVYGVGYRLEK